MKMLRKLRRLGFSKAIQAYSIDKTIEVMHDEIDATPSLNSAVFEELQDDHTLSKENYEIKLQDWVEDHANALHFERMQQIIAPFKAIARLLFD